MKSLFLSFLTLIVAAQNTVLRASPLSGATQSGGSITVQSTIGDPFAFAPISGGSYTFRPGWTTRQFRATSATIIPASIPEATFTSVTPFIVLDDTTLLPRTIADFSESSPLIFTTYSVSSNISTINASPVIEPTPINLSTSFRNATLIASLTLLDTLPDNFGLYAGDGLPDAWQKQYFGLENPLAAPTADPDLDRQSNLFEYLAGFAPNSSGSRLDFRITGKSASDISFSISKVIPTTRYRILEATSLTQPSPWPAAATIEPAASSPDFPVTIPASAPSTFYRLDLSPR